MSKPRFFYPGLIHCLALMLIFFHCQAEIKPVRKQIFFENGKVRRVYYEIGGKVEGKMTDYYNDGRLRSVRLFSNGVQSGRTEIYYPDGRLWEVQYYDTAGNRTGGDTIFYRNGTLQFTAQFKLNKKTGPMMKYDSTGTLIYAAEMDHDSLVRVLISPTDSLK